MTLRVGMIAGMAASLALPAAAETNAELEAQVRARETAFAKTMADRDHAAFQTFLADEAVFFGREGPTRGKQAVAAAWKPLYDTAKAAPFSWAPETVQVLDSGTLAISSGSVKDPTGKSVGVFNSIWRREKDGQWRVVFDKGCP
jgi:ketosteroid isomerase-like protein